MALSTNRQRSSVRFRFRRLKIGSWLLNIVLILLGILIFIPFYWVIISAILPPDQAYSLPPVWFPTRITFENILAVFELIPFWTQILNSIKISVIVTVGGVTTSVLAAYAFARLRFPGRNFLFIMLLSAMMIPTQVTVIPTFILIRNLGLMDTHEAVYLPALINVLGIFLLRQFYLTIPKELDEAAKIDGAGHLRTLWQIYLPLSWPSISALAIIIFQASWNDFFWPNLFLISQEKMTVPVGLVALQGIFGSGSPAVMFSAISIIVLPVLIFFIFTQRALTESIAASSLKR